MLTAKHYLDIAQQFNTNKDYKEIEPLIMKAASKGETSLTLTTIEKYKDYTLLIAKLEELGFKVSMSGIKNPDNSYTLLGFITIYWDSL